MSTPPYDQDGSLRTALAKSPALAMKRFPPRGRGVLLPTRHRVAAALGICMYTACRPPVLAAQILTHRLVSAFGVHLLPGRTVQLQLPAGRDVQLTLIEQWEQQLGPIDSVAVYQRRQAHRGGLTMIAVRGRIPLAVIKLRDEPDALDRENRALIALASSGTTTFRAPAAIGAGAVETWNWSAQEVVFTRPHRPVLDVAPKLFDEVSDVLSTLISASDGQVPAHRDITPWNLRRDSRGDIWLFDWEDWGLGPVNSDRTYFCASSRAVGGPPMPGGLPPEAIAYHRAIVEERRRCAPNVALPRRVLAALDEAAARATGTT